MQVERRKHRPRERPLSLEAPHVAAHHEQVQRRLVVDAVGGIFEAAVIPAPVQLRNIDVRGLGEINIAESLRAPNQTVAPRADDQLGLGARGRAPRGRRPALETFELLVNQVVVPTGQEHGRGINFGIPELHAVRLPVVVERRMAEEERVLGSVRHTVEGLDERQSSVHAVSVDIGPRRGLQVAVPEMTEIDRVL